MSDPGSGPPAIPSKGTAQKIGAWIRQNGRVIGAELLVNFLLPFVIYYAAVSRLGEAGALIASSAPPILWSIVEFIRHRRVDALSVLVLVGIALSLLGFIGGGGPRLLQLRERLATAVIGLVFVGSAVIGKPLIYQLARARLNRESPADAQLFDQLQTNKEFRRTMTVITVVWGLGMIAESALCCVLVFSLTIPQYMIVNPIVGYVSMGFLAAWTFWYTRPRSDEPKL